MKPNNHDAADTLWHFFSQTVRVGSARHNVHHVAGWGVLQGVEHMVEVRRTKMPGVRGQALKDWAELVVVANVRRRPRRCGSRAKLTCTNSQHSIDHRPTDCSRTRLRSIQIFEKFRSYLTPQERDQASARGAGRPQLFKRNGSRVSTSRVDNIDAVSQQRRHQGDGSLHTRNAPSRLVVVGARIPTSIGARAEVQRVHRNQAQGLRNGHQSRTLPLVPVPKTEFPPAGRYLESLRLNKHPVGGGLINPPPNPIGATHCFSTLAEWHHGRRPSRPRGDNFADRGLAPAETCSVTGRHVLNGLASRILETALYRQHDAILSPQSQRAPVLPIVLSDAPDKFGQLGCGAAGSAWSCPSAGQRGRSGSAS